MILSSALFILKKTQAIHDSNDMTQVQMIIIHEKSVSTKAPNDAHIKYER